MFFVSAIRPKITMRCSSCRDQSPLPRCPSLFLQRPRLSNPTHTVWTNREKRGKKEKREREREKEKRRESSHDSRRESTSGARSCLRVAGSMSQRSRLVSSRLVSVSSPSLSFSRIPVSHHPPPLPPPPPPRRCPDFSKVLRSASAVRL